MEAQGNVLSKVYKKASLKALKYFDIAYSEGKSILSVLREGDDEFRTMLKILEERGIEYTDHLSDITKNIVKSLEKGELLSCDHVGGYCKVTDEGIKASNEFNSAASNLDTILGGISKLGMQAFKGCVITESVSLLLRDLRYPFIPGEENPFIEAFIRAKGKPYDFILQIASLYYPFIFLLTANLITIQERRFKRFALTCNPRKHFTKKRIKEILSYEGAYPTKEEIKKILEEHIKRYNIPKLSSPLSALSISGLIENVKNEDFCTCGDIKYYRYDTYKLTERGRELATYMALNILLSYYSNKSEDIYRHSVCNEEIM